MRDVEVRQLMLMRHAKAEANGASDHARELTDRGRRDARSVGDWLEGQGLRPSYVLVSSAARARSTWTGVRSGLSGVADVDSVVLDALYGADAEEVVAECTVHIPPEATTALVIGHNPTIETAAGLLCSDSAPDTSMPTSAVAVIAVDCPWQELAPGCGSLVTLHTPRS
jgi:phosphohistidine phosphatase